MARDIKLTVAAATVGPQIKTEVRERAAFAVDVLKPMSEVQALTRTDVRAQVLGEAI